VVFVPQVFQPKPCVQLSSSPYVLYGLPLSLFLTWSPVYKTRPYPTVLQNLTRSLKRNASPFIALWEQFPCHTIWFYGTFLRRQL
jgi:hypothetical protein